MYLFNTHRLVCSRAFSRVQNNHHGVSPRQALHHPPFERILFQGVIASGRGGRLYCHLQLFRFHRDRKCDFVHANTFNIKSGLQSKLWPRFTLELGFGAARDGGGGSEWHRATSAQTQYTIYIYLTTGFHLPKQGARTEHKGAQTESKAAESEHWV